MYTHFLQEKSYIGHVRNREVNYKRKCELGSINDVGYREVSPIKFPLHRGFVMRVVPEKSGRCREVCTIKDVQ